MLNNPQVSNADPTPMSLATSGPNIRVSMDFHPRLERTPTVKFCARVNRI